MTTQTKSASVQDINPIIDLMMIIGGIVTGGAAALLGLWLWFDYQANPAGSALALFSGQLATILPETLHTYLAHQTQVMGLPLTGQTSAYWYMARAGGMVAYLLMWFSTVWGLTLSSKITGKFIPMPLVYGLHEFLSILALLFSLFHAIVLLGDEYISFNIFHLAVPFTAPYEPLATGLGTIALYLTAALTVSFYVRKFIGQKIWRKLHFAAFAAYLLVLIHAIVSGSDSGLLVTILLYWSTGFVVLFLTYYRLLTLKGRR